MSAELRVFPLEGIPEVEEGDDLAALLADAAVRAGGLEDGDVVVVAQKVVSKAEGRVAEERGQVVTLLDLRDALQREDPELAGRSHPEPESGGPGSPVRRRPACAL